MYHGRRIYIMGDSNYVELQELIGRERRRCDRLTGILNREPAERLIEQYLRENGTGAFFFMDIDNFKMVNDLKGHPEGDRVLHDFAQRLKVIFPEDGIVARLGGDEFIVFLPGRLDKEELKTYAEKVIATSNNLIEDPFLDSKLGVSLGIALAPKDGHSFALLYANADKGQYYVKRNGKGQYCFYEQSPTILSNAEPTDSMGLLEKLALNNKRDEVGALVVGDETFARICQFVERNILRMQKNTQLILFTLHYATEYMTDPEIAEELRKLLCRVIQFDLRKGDLMLEFSNSQVAALLVNCETDSATMVGNRIVEDFFKHNIAVDIQVTFEVQALKEKNCG